MTTAIVWFRQDLRLQDNPAFFKACTYYKNIIPLYILEEKTSVLGKAQAWWLHHSLNALHQSLRSQLQLELVLRKGDPLEILLQLIQSIPIKAIYWNRCYEPLAINRDKKIKATLQDCGMDVQSFNAILLNEPWTIQTKNGDFFKVFTPYWKTCKQTLSCNPIPELNHHPGGIPVTSDTLQDWKLLPALNWAAQFPQFWTPGEEGAQKRLTEFLGQNLQGYKTHRDFPAQQATSRLSPHLHFGELSPWAIVRAIQRIQRDSPRDLASIEHFLAELGWREFSYYLLYHVPTLPEQNFKKEFDAFPWHKEKSLLTCWQKGLTGYPIIDAGMRELWATGYMHNRVRMITASFLTKGLFMDWRLGADWFLDTLVDADLASNSVNWQWVAGCGVDAAPYFRIFNPVLQSQKFDPLGAYIRHWVPELSSLEKDVIHAPWEAANAAAIYAKIDYPKPIIHHKDARSKALAYYQQLKKKE